MASWFTRALDKVTPWRRQGEVQRDQESQERKRRRDEENRASQPQLNRLQQQGRNDPVIRQVTNNFEQPKQDRGFSTVKAPNLIDTAAPKQSFFNKVRDQFDANTEADQYRRAKGNLEKGENKDLILKDPGNLATKTRDFVVDGAKSLGRGAKNVFITNPTESAREATAQLTGNREAQRASQYRRNRAAYGKETADRIAGGGKADFGDLASAVGDTVSVLPAVGGAKIAATGVRQGIKQGGTQGIKTAAKTTAQGLDEALLGVKDAVDLGRFIKRGVSKPKAKSFSAPRAASQNIDNDAIGRSVDALIDDLAPKAIPVNQVASLGESLNVRNLTNERPMIRELGGDASRATTAREAEEVMLRARAEEARVANSTARPDQRIEGMTKTPTEAPTANTITKEGVLNEYIFNQQKKLAQDISQNPSKKNVLIKQYQNRIEKVDADKLLELKETDRIKVETPASSGKTIPIEVKDVRSIPVVDETISVTSSPGKANTVRETRVADNLAQQTDAAASQPVVTPPAQISAQSQAVLDNPKKYTKREVAAARRQRDLARKVRDAKVKNSDYQAEIAEVSGTPSNKGFVPTGEYKVGKNKNIYESAKDAAEKAQANQDIANMSIDEIVTNARNNINRNGAYSPEDIRNLDALKKSKRIARGTPEYNVVAALHADAGSKAGQTLSLFDRTARRESSATQLIGRFESKVYRMVDDPSKVDSKIFDDVEAALSSFTEARDSSKALLENALKNPTQANTKLAVEVAKKAEDLDRAAKITEYKAAQSILKKNKNIEVTRELEKMASAGDIRQMDYVDSAMLSGTGTFTRNFANSNLAALEDAVFGKVGARIGKGITGEAVGGGLGRGSLKGAKEGAVNLVSTAKARSDIAGKNPLEHLKNFATTGNQIGDVALEAQVKANVLDHYKQLLKSQGYTGAELKNRSQLMALSDPNNATQLYENTARAAAGLGETLTSLSKNKVKMESSIKNSVSDYLARQFNGGVPTQATENTGKLVARLTVGFPSVMLNSLEQGVNRTLAGVPTMVRAATTKDPVQKAVLIKEAVKQFGTGAIAMPAIFGTLGSMGIITGAYPKGDPEEQARWEREGISENSIKIGDHYYQLPGYMGSFALPAMFWASMGRNDNNIGMAIQDVAKAAPSIVPIEQNQNLSDVFSGRDTFGEFASKTGASAVRAMTPVGALLNQISKAFDPTKNDTNTGSDMENFLDKVLSGIPGQNLFANIPDKLDDEGNSIQNTNAFETMFGAASKEQSRGMETSQEIQDEIGRSVQLLNDMGITADPNLLDILDDDAKKIMVQLGAGRKVSEKDIKSLKKAFTDGVGDTGDTAYLEREQYDTHLRALALKKELMESDKTTKPSSIEKIDLAINRGNIYKENDIPYELIDQYKSIGVEDWRKMGYPPGHDKYDPDFYNPDLLDQLYALDELMTGKNASYGKKPDRQKYSFPDEYTGKSSGKGKKNTPNSDFSTLKTSSLAPKTREYATIEVGGRSTPRIKRITPNIVHKISASR